MVIHDVSKNKKQKTLFLSGQKSNFNLKNLGYFGKNKYSEFVFKLW